MARSTTLIARLLLVTFLIIGCAPTTSPLTGDRAGLEAAVARWGDLGASRYQFSLQIDCYCLEEYRGPFLVEVDGETVAISRAGVAVSEEVRAALPLPVEALFARVRARLDDVSLRLVFDQTTGLPIEFYSDPIPAAADDEWGFHLDAIVIS
jgi:hypothetical protein